jgi:hypothetical protein
MVLSTLTHNRYIYSNYSREEDEVGIPYTFSVISNLDRIR